MAVALVTAVVVVLVLAQLLGPAIAAHVVRSKVGRYGTVHSVSVKAWPAIELAWKHADEVKVRAGSLRMSESQTTGLLEEAGGTTTVSAYAEAVELGGLRLTDATLRKRGSELWAQGTASEADVAKALPPGVKVSLVSSAGGEVRVRASGGLFGLSASIEAVAYTADGELVAAPTGLLSGLRLTLFDSRRVYVEGVDARALESGPGGEARYELSMWGRLR